MVAIGKWSSSHGASDAGGTEARQQLAECSVRELEVDQDVVRGRHLDGLADQRAASHGPGRVAMDPIAWTRATGPRSIVSACRR